MSSDPSVASARWEATCPGRRGQSPSTCGRPANPATPPPTLPFVDTFDVYGVRAEDAGATNQGPATTVIYLHGGAYVNEIQSAHRKLITDLATQLGCSVPIYGLAPSHHAADALTPSGRTRTRAVETHLRASVS
jgi:acetyl esterase/lipase